MNEQVFQLDTHNVSEVFPQSYGQDRIDWGLNAIMAPQAWRKTKGEGIKVAILDTGVDTEHPDLRSNIAAVADFTGSTYGPKDVNGHGTHVAGIIAGTDNNIGIIGVAPQAKLYCAKVLSDTGGGSFDSVMKGLSWAIAQGVDVINMSLGTHAEPPQQLHALIQQAKAHGIILVAATGNENTQVGYPAMYDETIAVSAMDMTYDRASFSNYGIKNEIMAPGVDIISTYKNGQYAKLSGTSMATPIIAGSIALYLSLFRNNTKPTVEQVHQKLLASTVDLGKDGKDEYFGAGLINLAKLI